MQGIPEKVREFITSHFDSIVKLEVLLLLRSAPEVAWDCESVAKSLSVASEMMKRPLADLHIRGLLSAEGTPTVYRYAPATDELRTMVDVVAGTYLTHRVAVQTIIHTPPLDGARSFADAFRLRKEP